MALPVTGGTALSVDAAPWAVLVVQASGGSARSCGGSILDSTHVLTAAHCLYDASGAQAPARSLFVRAGISDARSPRAADVEQGRAVASTHVFPGYVWTDGAASGDIAVLTLARPLVLGGPAARAIALPPVGSPAPDGAQAMLAGFGQEIAGVPSNGSLQLFAGTVHAGTGCPSSADGQGVCASSPSSSVCAGDSGSGLVTVGPPRTLIGVVSSGPADCAAGSEGLFTSVGDPQIRAFLAANTRATGRR